MWPELGTCAAQPVADSYPAAPLSQPFAQWTDTADYVLVPDGGLEAGGAEWTLARGAAVVEGNEPFQVGGASDHLALAGR